MAGRGAGPAVTVNGRPRPLTGVGPHTTALDWLRGLGLTGAKEGCAEGECGACSVLVARPDGEGSRWVALNACLVPAAALDGQEVVTVEGLGTPEDLHPVQRELAGRGGSQCGYCTPGFVVGMAAEYYRRDRAVDDAGTPDAEHGPNGFDLQALSGNLCRCTGYRPIRDAAFALGPPRADDPLAARLGRPAPAPVATRIEDATGVFLRPESLAEALALLRDHPEARPVAGCTDWGVEVNLRGARAPYLVAVDRLPELRELSVPPTSDGAIEVGAALSLSEVERLLAGRVPLLSELFPLFGSPQIRNVATIGGSLATASPIGDLAPALLALEATVVLVSAAGDREVPLDRYFTGYRRTELRPGELIRSVRVPRPLAGLTAFHKVAKRRYDDISSVAVAFALDVVDGTVARARIGLGGVAATPTRALATERALEGRSWSVETVHAAAVVLRGEGTPIDDHRATAAYRAAMLEQSLLKALGGGDPAGRRGRGAGMTDLSTRPADAVVGLGVPHESAALHVTGAALYTDDLVVRTQGCLHAHPVQAPYAHARVTALRTAPALEVPGVVRVLGAEDVPGVDDAGIWNDEPLFPHEVMYVGHAVCWVLGETLEAARLGAAAVEVDYEPLPALLTITEAIAASSFQGVQPTIQRGDVEGALATAAHVFSGVTEASGQEHFYLETQCALAQLDESGQVFVQSSTQHPTETQEVVARVLGLRDHHVTVQSLRMGGAFGGKEMQPHGYAAIAALGSVVTGRPVRVRLTRAQDFTMTGKRHGVRAEWRVGFGADGLLQALEVTLTLDGGWSLDLSQAVLSRSLCHVDNAYYVPHIRLRGRIARTHKTSQTAFRGFGGPQGMLVIEDVLGRCAPLLGIDPLELRRRNFYADGQSTPYGQVVRHPERAGLVWDEVLTRARVEDRQVEIAAFNAAHRHTKRGLAATPVKFGIAFNFVPFNQAGALVHVYKDGSVLVNHGGTEMGQGLHTKMLQVAATTLGVPLEQVRLAPTRTDKVPNTSATAASSGADLNGAAVKHACEQIRTRLQVLADGRDIGWEDLVREAYAGRVPLWAAGFYRTEGLAWDPSVMQGHPFKYFAYGAAATEVEVDGFTGASRIRRVDIVHDVGDSLSPLVDLGQIEGGFVQGAGWLTLEDLRWDESDGPTRGRLATQAASTYKLPGIGEMPEDFRVSLLQHAPEDGAIFGSKAVGEPPLMLAISVREAIRGAVAAFGRAGVSVDLPSPATPEAVFWAVERARRGASDQQGAPAATEGG